MNSIKRTREKTKVSKYIFTHLWYIVDLYDIRRPRIIRTHFADEKSARIIIRKKLKNNTIRYDVISGKRAKKLKMQFVDKVRAKKMEISEGHGMIGQLRITKYHYPETHDQNQQRRKTFRTIARRKKKKGLLKKRHQNTITHIKPKEL